MSSEATAPAVMNRKPVNMDGAMHSFAESFGAVNALRVESCIHCGMCAEACHFYIATEDPKYTPILKVEPLKQTYKREAGPLAPVFRWLGLKRQVTAEELEEWQELLYDSCNLCGRCSLICPMGIDVAALIEEGRRAMFDAGLAPDDLYQLAEHQHRTGDPGPSEPPYREKLEAIGRDAGLDIPMDRDKARVMLCVSSVEVDNYPKEVAALARVMQYLEEDFTFRSDALLVENYAYFAGSREWQRDISRRLIDQAVACSAEIVIVPECGHAYTALRWEAAELYGKELPFRVVHISEYLAEQLRAGRLKLRKTDGKPVTFHDPCQIVRKGGVMEAPRELMEAMGVDLREMENNRGFSFCCTGGGGVLLIGRAAPLRYRAVEQKLREVDATGAGTLLTTCTGCRYSFDDAKQHFNWDKSPHSLLELVVDHLVEE
jgi:Fe-S oxidoreductase